MSLRLEVVAGNAAGEKLSIDDGIVFGRLGDKPGSRLGGDPELSRHHAEVALAPSGQYSIEDLSSTNGTYVNGERLEHPAMLAAGDVIDLGATKLIVREAPDVMPPAPAPDAMPPAPGPDAMPPAPGPDAMPPAPAPDAMPPAPALVDVRTASTIIDLIPGVPLTPTDAPTPEERPTERDKLADGPRATPDISALEPPTEASSPAEAPAPAALPAPAAPLELRVVVDFEACEAEIGFQGWAAPIRLRHRDGRWRVSNAGP